MTTYETRDIRFSAVAKAFGGLALALVLVALVSAAALRLFSARSRGTARVSPPPPEPRLQAHAAADFRRFRAEEEAALNGSAWVDRSRGTVRVPIERAMALLLKRGLPTRAASERPPK
jgi:hypothetical protein